MNPATEALLHPDCVTHGCDEKLMGRSACGAVCRFAMRHANPYSAQGSATEAWERGYEGRRMLAAPGSDYARIYAEGVAARTRGVTGTFNDQQEKP